MTTPPPESTALSSALSSLLNSPPNHLARHARLVSRAADDAEVAAAETSHPSTRHALMEQVDMARAAALTARNQARHAALAHNRHALFETPTNPAHPTQSTPAESPASAHVAREINDGLRRVTALVKDQVDRSRAAGGVLDESSRRLRITRDRHAAYGHVVASGAVTLKQLRTVDLIANVAVFLSFIFFFLVAGYVVHRRLARSNTAVFLVRPAVKIITAPVRLLNAAIHMLMRKRPGTNDAPRAPTISEAAQADLSLKATKGRGQPPVPSLNPTTPSHPASDRPHPHIDPNPPSLSEHPTTSMHAAPEEEEQGSRRMGASGEANVSDDAHGSENQEQKSMDDRKAQQNVKSLESPAELSAHAQHTKGEEKQMPFESPIAEDVTIAHTYPVSHDHSERHSEL